MTVRAEAVSCNMSRRPKRQPYGQKGAGNTYCTCDCHYGPDPDNKSNKKRARRKAKEEIKDETST